MISLRLPDLGLAARWAALAAGAVAAGWLIARGDAKFVAGFGVVAALLPLAVRAPGPLAALLLLAVLNGVPIISLGGRLPGGLKYQDAAVFALAALLFAYKDRTPSAPRARLMRAAMIWSGCFIGWWIYEFARSALLDGVPPLKAALFGRDFLYFVILLPLALRAKFPARSLRAGALVLSIAVALFAIGAIIASLSGRSLSWLIHPAILDTTTDASGARVYSSMYYLVNTSLIFASAFLLSKHMRGKRVPAGGTVLLLLVAAMLQQTRANYFALAAALLTGVLVYMLWFGSFGGILLRGTVVISLIVVAVLGVSSVGSNRVAQTPVVSTVATRVTSGISNFSQSTGTVGYRENVDAEMLRLLGNKWPIGLGFLHPAARYISALPGGTIRNSDTGAFNILMTMGLVGVFLLYAPLAHGLRELLRAGRTTRSSSQSAPPWIVYGGAAWLAWAVAGSPTLGLLFSVSGLVFTALTLAALAYVLEPGGLFRSEDRKQATREEVCLPVAGNGLQWRT